MLKGPGLFIAMRTCIVTVTLSPFKCSVRQVVAQGVVGFVSRFETATHGVPTAPAAARAAYPRGNRPQVPVLMAKRNCLNTDDDNGDDW